VQAAGAVLLEPVELLSPVGEIIPEFVPEGMMVVRVPPFPTDTTGFRVVEGAAVEEEMVDDCVGVEVATGRSVSKKDQ